MPSFNIVETDNFDGDYPDELFVNLPSMDEESCKRIASIVNESTGGTHSSRYWKVVDSDYTLIGGFEP